MQAMGGPDAFVDFEIRMRNISQIISPTQIQNEAEERKLIDRLLGISGEMSFGEESGQANQQAADEPVMGAADETQAGKAQISEGTSDQKTLGMFDPSELTKLISDQMSTITSDLSAKIAADCSAKITAEVNQAIAAERKRLDTQIQIFQDTIHKDEQRRIQVRSYRTIQEGSNLATLRQIELFLEVG